MDSEGYYTYYYCSAFTQQERKQLKELFGRDLFRKGCVVSYKYQRPVNTSTY